MTLSARVQLFSVIRLTLFLLQPSLAFTATQPVASSRCSMASHPNLQNSPTTRRNTNHDVTCIDDSKDMEQFIKESRGIFLEWAHSNMIPLGDDDGDEGALEAIAAAIGDARVVALTEGCHNSRQMMELHFRLVRHLVEHHNFTTVLTETGFPESRIILEYVRGKEIEMDREEMYQIGLNKMYSAWEEGREMIEWIKEYNRHQDTSDEEHEVHYYGVDIGGFYQNWKTPLKEVLGYLQRYVFTAKKAYVIMELTKRFEPILEAMAKDARKHYTDRMTREERADLALLLDETVDLFASMESEYVERSGRFEYEWARQSLLSMQLAENYYRNYLERGNPYSSKFVGLNGREIAMHRNILWALKQRPASKVIWINHAVHTKSETQYQGELWGFLTPTGAMLRESIGNDLFMIGLVYGSGEYWKDWQKGAEHRCVAPVPRPHEDGLETVLGSLVDKKSLPMCFVPWAKAPVGAWPWLQSFSSIRENDYHIKIKPLEWQACLYIDKVSPATPKRSMPEIEI